MNFATTLWVVVDGRSGNQYCPIGTLNGDWHVFGLIEEGKGVKDLLPWQVRHMRGTTVMSSPLRWQQITSNNEVIA